MTASVATASILLFIVTAASLPAKILFKADFETGDLSEWSSTGTRGQNAKPRNIELVSDIVQQGKYAAKFTIHEDDVFNDRQLRVQLGGPRVTVEEGSDTYMSFSLYMAEPPKDRDNFFYWEGNPPPRYNNVMTWWVEPKDGGGTWIRYGTGNLGRNGTEWEADFTTGKWHRLAMHIRWSEDATKGNVRLWFDGKLVMDKKLKTKGPESVYFCQPGIHRSPHKPFVDSIYFDNFILADTLEEVLDSGPAVGILEANCSQCHSKTMSMAGLDLSTREAAIKGGSRGAAIVPGKAAESKLIEAVERKGKLVMPPAKALTEAEVAVLRRWIDQGAPWTQPTASAPSTSKWWAFQKVQRPAVPANVASNPIDAFVQLKLKAASLAPAPRADAATLARRAYLDLWGLPPTLEQVREFTSDRSTDAWPKLIDKLLASPHYGEKWGRHWLDLVRYSDTAGFELDSYIHDAWRYRDWVIQAFNDDKPYDLFIREQIAADELFPEDPVARTGTGLYCVGPNRDLFPDQADINREELLTDYVDTTSAVFLGMTAGCARCHDHKFDPISQEDYFRVRAIFAPATRTRVALNRLGSLTFDIRESMREWKLREIGDQIRAIQSRCQDTIVTAKKRGLTAEAAEAVRASDDEIRACLSPAETERLHGIEKMLVGWYADYRPKPFSCGLVDSWNVAPRTFLPARGSRPEREVQPGFFSVLGGGEVPPPAEKREATGPIPLMPTTGRRAALAGWIANAANPLTARVMVNRVWQYHFGRGLIATPSDFGTRSGLPTHPELLDWLASEFVEKGWSIKQLHRLMMTSATYQQSSIASAAAADRDPVNLLLSHFTRRRLNSDEIRDSVLLATGGLNPKAGGRPVVPPLTPEEMATLTQRPSDAWVLTADTSEHSRRSIYLIQKRTFRMPMMEVFDAPDSMLTCSRRESSTTAPQSLTLFNGALTLERARAMAQRLAANPAGDESVIRNAWRNVLSRDPNSQELSRATAFLSTQSKNAGTRTDAITELVRALLNLNEFLYVD